MTSTIDNNDSLVHYSNHGWQNETKFGEDVHSPTANLDDPTVDLTLEFDGVSDHLSFLPNIELCHT